MLKLPDGLTYECAIRVSEDLTVPKLPSQFPGLTGMPPVFATAYVVAFLEATCIAALAPYMEGDECTVGTQISMSHTAATPVGFGAIATVELTEADGRKLTFRVTCRDDTEIVAEGVHERFVVERSRFDKRLAGKVEARGSEAPA